MSDCCQMVSPLVVSPLVVSHLVVPPLVVPPLVVPPLVVSPLVVPHVLLVVRKVSFHPHTHPHFGHHSVTCKHGGDVVLEIKQFSVQILFIILLTAAFVPPLSGHTLHLSSF